MEVSSGLQEMLRVLSRGSRSFFPTLNTPSLWSAIPFPTRATLHSPVLLLPSTMGRKLDPTKEKRGPGRKARKQKGAETELARFLPTGKGQASLQMILQLLRHSFICIYKPPRSVF